MAGRKFAISGPTRRRRGAALVELAIVLPILFLIIVGIIEFGNLMFTRHKLIDIATKAANKAVQPGMTEENITAYVEGLLEENHLENVSIQITTQEIPEDNLVKETVQLVLPYADATLVGGVIPLDVELSGTATALGSNYDGPF